MGGIRVTLPCQLAPKLQRLLPTNTCFAEVSTYNALMHWDGASVSRLSEGSRRRRASSEHGSGLIPQIPQRRALASYGHAVRSLVRHLCLAGLVPCCAPRPFWPPLWARPPSS